MPYWYNIDTGMVESEENRGQDANLLGPYDSQEEAGRALEIARERTETWDEADRRWEAGEDAD